MTIDYAAAAPVLRAAADHIETHGWRRGVSLAYGEACCAAIAVHRVKGVMPLEEDAALAALDQYLTADPSPYGYDRRLDEAPRSAIVGWNDFHVDNGDVVVSAMRNAATWAEGRAKR
jgi:hypothetical protein